MPIFLKKALHCAVLWTFVLLSNSLTADHVNGGEISYKHIVQGKYQIYLILYRDCNECEFNQGGCLDVTKLNIYASQSYQGASSKVGELGLSFLKREDLSPLCKGVSSKCVGGTSTIGTEAWTWSALVDLDTFNKDYCEFEIGIRVENRKAVYGTSKQAFYTHAIINRCNDQENNSAVFNAKPIHHLQIGESQSYSLLASDIDHDSLSYHLVKSQKSKDISISYPIGVSASKPISVQCNSTCDYEPKVWPVQGFGIDSFTGICSFTPNTANQNGFLVIEVREWRAVNGKMELVGLTRRDLLLTTINGQNRSTKLKVYEAEVFNCDKSKLQKDIGVNDPIAAGISDSIILSIFSPNGTSSIGDSRSKNNVFDAIYNYTPNPGSRAYDFITIVASDNHCPLEQVSYSTIVVRYPEAPKAASLLRNERCNVLECSALQAPKSSDYDLWVLHDESGSQVSQFSGRKGSWDMDSAGLYTVKHEVVNARNRCKSIIWDTILIKDFNLITGTSKFPEKICSKQEYILGTVPIGGIGPFKKTWNSWYIANSLPLSIDQDTTISVWIEDSRGCAYSYNAIIDVFSETKLKGIDTGFCFSNGAPYMLNELIEISPKKSQILHFSIIEGLGYLTSSEDSSYTYTTSHIENTRFAVSAIDENSCKYYDTLSLDIVRPLATEMITSKSLCNNVGLINLDAISEKKIDGGYWYGNSIIVRNNQYFFPNGETGEHLFFYVHNHLGCVFEDSIRIELRKAPIISFIQPRQMNLCTSSAVIKLSANPSGGSWVNTDGNDGSINPSQRYESQAVSTVKYIFRDHSNACKAEDSIKIIINPAVEYFVPSDIAFCSNKRKAFDVKIKNNALASQFSSDGDIELDRIGDETFVIAASKAKNTVELASIRLKIKALEGCEDQNITIPIRIKPVPKVGFLPKHEEGCSPFTFEANTRSVNNVQPDWFEWRLNGEIVGNNSSVKHRIVVPSGYTIALTAGLDGCQSETVASRLQVLETVEPLIQSDPSSKIISQDYPFITFSDRSLSKIEYTRLWNFPGAKVSNLSALKPWVNYPGDTGVYKVLLHLKTLEGCESKDSIYIYLSPKYNFFIPSAFSPNHKGPDKNERFRPFGDELINYHLEVYNSLKNKVFETEDFYEGWDGKTPRGDAQAGVYIWMLKGRNSRGVLIEHQGLVTLLR